MQQSTFGKYAEAPCSKAKAREGHLSRRSFLRMGVGALGALALIEAGAAGFLFLRAGSQQGEFGGVITAGSVSDFRPGSVTEFAAAHFFLVRAPDGGFLALHSRCTHLGCTVNWVPGQEEFVCPCHAASFDGFGDFFGPPVPRPLDTFPVSFAEGQVRVDTTEPLQRECYDPAQLAYPPAEAGQSRQGMEDGTARGKSA
ncbi:MAG: ubiquinol-cytochrome c reductase iron-sulfur subunit [Anaerolineae bacterium]